MIMRLCTSEFIATTINAVCVLLFITFNGNVLVSNRISLAVIIDIHDGGAIAGNGLLGDGLDIIVFAVIEVAVTGRNCSSICQRTSGALLYFRTEVGIVRIIRVFQPVDDGIVGFTTGGPVGSQVCAGADRGNRISYTLHIPTLEIVARLDRGLRRKGGTGLTEHGGHVLAAVHIKGNPEAFLYIRGQGDAACLEGHGGDFRVSVLPAQDTIIGFQTSGSSGFCQGKFIVSHLLAGLTLGSMANRSVFIQEEDIAHILKLRTDMDVFVLCHIINCDLCVAVANSGTICIPAGKLRVFLCRRGRQAQRIAVRYNLGPRLNGFAVFFNIIEIIRMVLSAIRDLQIEIIDFRQSFRLHIVDAEGPVLGGLRGEGQGSGAVIIGEDILRVGVHGNRAGNSGQGHFGAGLAGDGDGVDLGVGERHLRTLRGFLLQVTADGVGHIGRLLLGGSLLGGCGGHGDLPDLFLVAHGIGDDGIALGYAEDIGNGPASIIDPAQSGSSRVIGIGPGAAGLKGRGQGDGLANRYAAVIGLLFLRLLSSGVLSLGVLSLGVLSGGILSRGILSRGILSLGLLNCGFLSRRFLGFGFLNRRFLDLGFLSSRLHDGRLRLGDYRGGGAEREGVGGA